MNLSPQRVYRMIRLRCGFLPDGFQAASFTTLRFQAHGEQLGLQLPVLSTEEVVQLYAKVAEARSLIIREYTTERIIDVLDRTMRLWSDPTYPLRVTAERWLPVITGYDPEMVRLFLHRYIRNFRKEQLLRIVEESFPNPAVLDEFRPKRTGGLTRAYGPVMVTHIFSGNVPLLPLWSLISSLLLKSATVGKVSSSEPLFPSLLAESLREVDPQLAEMIAILWWQGGDEAMERAAFGGSDALIAYGHDRTIHAIQAKLPAHVQFHPHGHKVSFGVIAREALTTTTVQLSARNAARDAAWFDQQGCLSPHVFFVESGGRYSPRDFARLLAAEMERQHHKHPRRALDEQEAQAWLAAVSTYEFRAMHDSSIEVHGDAASREWCVIYSENEAFPLSPLNRWIHVVPIDGPEELPVRTRSMRKHLQTAGIACPPQRYTAWYEALGDCGVDRICAIGAMFQPEAGWHHDGRPHLGELVRWCDVESSVERQMDAFDPYRS